MPLEDQESWLQPFGVDTFAGRCEFTFNDSIPITVETAGDGNLIIFAATLAPLTDDAPSDVLRRILSMNRKGQRTGGGTLALDETGRSLVLWLGWPTAALDGASFAALFGTFLDHADELRAEIGRQLTAQNAADDAAPLRGGNILQV